MEELQRVVPVARHRGGRPVRRPPEVALEPRGLRRDVQERAPPRRRRGERELLTVGAPALVRDPEAVGGQVGNVAADVQRGGLGTAPGERPSDDVREDECGDDGEGDGRSNGIVAPAVEVPGLPGPDARGPRGHPLPRRGGIERDGAAGDGRAAHRLGVARVVPVRRGLDSGGVVGPVDPDPVAGGGARGAVEGRVNMAGVFGDGAAQAEGPRNDVERDRRRDGVVAGAVYVPGRPRAQLQGPRLGPSPRRGGVERHRTGGDRRPAHWKGMEEVGRRFGVGCHGMEKVWRTVREEACTLVAPGDFVPDVFASSHNLSKVGGGMSCRRVCCGMMSAGARPWCVSV